MGPEVHYNPYHVTVVRLHLTRNIEVLHPHIRDEVVTSFTEVLNLTENGEEYCSTCVFYALIWKHSEWKSVPALSVVEKIVCRVSNRAFVGFPLCMFPAYHLYPSYLSQITPGRNPDWIDLNISCASDLIQGGVIVGMFPKFMRSSVDTLFCLWNSF